MITIYCTEITPRIQYSFDLIFRELLGAEFELIDDLEVFMENSTFKICYSEFDLGGFWIQSSKFLFQNTIRDIEVNFDFDQNHRKIIGNHREIIRNS